MAVFGNFVLVLVLGIVSATEKVNIKFKDGRINGIKMKSEYGIGYLAFLGIPYAEPPQGQLRFKPPVTKKREDMENLNATKDGPLCFQIDFFTNKLIGQEDCLYLNVYTTEAILVNPDKKYPVVVLIHGLGWQVGSGSSWFFGPGKFMDKDVVFVSMNYRLGPLGFLSTNDDSAPGNYGMLDQVEALKWVKENIEDFGGDPEQVTIFGQSAGAVSVFYHMLSPLSKGLFHRVIALSGNPLNWWAIATDPIRWTIMLARNLNCSVINSTELINCLRSIVAETLINATTLFSAIATVPFTPITDGKFLQDDPAKMLTEGRICSKVPVITGLTKDEGAGIYPLLYPELMEYSDEYLDTFVKITFNDPPNSDLLSKAIKDEYFKDIDLRNKLEVAKRTVKVISDSMNASNYASVKFLTQSGSKTYTYSHDFQANKSFVNFLGFKYNLGVGHSDDLIEIFENKLFQSIADEEISSKWISIVTNFAKSGDPNGNLGVYWPPITPNEIPVCHIDKPMTIQHLKPKNISEYDFWLREVPKIIQPISSPK